jgi:hypothetical protein
MAEAQKNQQEKLERMAAQFHLYLCYVHHMDITPADGNGLHIAEEMDNPKVKEF